MDIKEIQSLIKFVAKSGASEVKLEMEDIKITIRTGSIGHNYPETTLVQQIPMPQAPSAPVGAPQTAPQAQQAAPTEAAQGEDSKYIPLKSPIIGTFYRKPSPDTPPLVEPGSTIAQGDVLYVTAAIELSNDLA